MRLQAIESTHETYPIGWLFQRVSRKGYPREDLLSVYRDHGVVPKASRDDNHNRPSEDLGGYQLVNPGDLVINKMKAWQGSVAVSRHRGIVSPAYFIYRPRHEADSGYLHYLLRCQPMFSAYGAISKGIRVGQWDLIPEEFERLRIPLPPLPEQRAIAAYLDRETGDIDALVAEQERLIATLRERRAAVVEGALTRGLNSASLKPTGSAYFPALPAAWEVARAKRVIGSGPATGVSPLPGDAPDLRSLSLGAVRDGLVRSDADVTKFVNRSAVTDVAANRLRSGDILIVRGNGNLRLVGRAGLVGPDFDEVESIYPDLLIRVRTNYRMDPRFFVFAWNSENGRAQIEALANTATGIHKVSADTVRGIAVPLPPLAEQRRIADYLDEKTTEIDALIAECERFIAVVKERRAALITAAVTGQIDCTHLIEETA